MSIGVGGCLSWRVGVHRGIWMSIGAWVFIGESEGVSTGGIGVYRGALVSIGVYEVWVGIYRCTEGYGCV